MLNEKKLLLLLLIIYSCPVYFKKMKKDKDRYPRSLYLFAFLEIDFELNGFLQFKVNLNSILRPNFCISTSKYNNFEMIRAGSQNWVRKGSNRFLDSQAVILGGRKRDPTDQKFPKKLENLDYL